MTTLRGFSGERTMRGSTALFCSKRAVLLLSRQLSLYVTELYGCVYPVVDKLSESLVVADLCSNRPEL